MALNEVFEILYILDILYYTVISDSWGIGIVICRYCGKLITHNNVLGGHGNFICYTVISFSIYKILPIF
jgi:hypothetical protein